MDDCLPVVAADIPVVRAPKIIWAPIAALTLQPVLLAL